MKRRKLIIYSLLICLPASLVMVAGLYVSLAWAPRIIRNEPRRVTLIYREEAERLKDLLSSEVRFVHKRPAGAAIGKIDGAPWGLCVNGGTNWVWCQSFATDGRKAWRIAECPRYDSIPWGWIIHGSVSGISLAMLALTALAVWNFVRFMKERDDFLAATAHDLTTPLVGLRMMIGRNDEEARVLVEKMLRLVGNIKDFLRLGGRRHPSEVTEFDVISVYRSAYSLFAADYRDLFDGADVPVTSERDVMKVRADELLTMQVIWNLLGNELKYAAPYGKVEVRVVREGKFVKVAFVDEGQGMSSRQMRKAFDRYYRAKTVLESGKGGFGIGLCTAREFAEAMGGRLTVSDNRPKGCIFALYLPSAI